MPLFQLVYVSAAKFHFDAPALQALLETSRRNNAAKNITGLLLYQDARFIQAIEGEHESVLRLYDRLAKDPRHHSIIKLAAQDVSQRDFPDWAMGYPQSTLAFSESKPGYSDFMNHDFEPMAAGGDASKVRRMLDVFRRSFRPGHGYS